MNTLETKACTRKLMAGSSAQASNALAAKNETRLKLLAPSVAVALKKVGHLTAVSEHIKSFACALRQFGKVCHGVFLHHTAGAVGVKTLCAQRRTTSTQKFPLVYDFSPRYGSVMKKEKHPHAAALTRVGREPILAHYNISKQAYSNWTVRGVPSMLIKSLRTLAAVRGVPVPELYATENEEQVNA